MGLVMLKHRALTGFVSRKWDRNPNYLKHIFISCDVSRFFGALPFELCQRVPKSKIAYVTNLFHIKLQCFLREYFAEMSEMATAKVYDLTDLGNMFDTKCILFARGGSRSAENPWSGGIGFVCKMSFPEINLDYALKLYYMDLAYYMGFASWSCGNHGPLFEIPTAFAAGRAEPRDNNRVYIASLSVVPYLLSKWAGDEIEDNGARENKNQIFVTATHEDEARNRRKGQRIDWGETYLSDYGAMSYRGRKMFRQIMACDERAFSKSCDVAKDGIAKKDLERAMRVADLIAYFDNNVVVQNFLCKFKQR